MLLGHYGLAFAAKRIAPRTSLGTLTFAAQWLDELWPLLLLTGVEYVRIAPGLMPGCQLDFVSYPVSHSLMAAVGWGLLIGAVYALARRAPQAAWIVGGLVVSHWLLDVMVHRPDLPVLPGGPYVGLGAWRSLPLTFLLEGVFYGGGLLVYVRATRPANWVGRYALWAYVATQVIIFVGSAFGPPPASTHEIAFGALALWLFVPWAAWIDRHRLPSLPPLPPLSPLPPGSAAIVEDAAAPLPLPPATPPTPL
jgi:hypothetical protein